MGRRGSRANGTNPRTLGTSPLAEGTNLRNQPADPQEATTSANTDSVAGDPWAAKIARAELELAANRDRIENGTTADTRTRNRWRRRR